MMSRLRLIAPVAVALLVAFPAVHAAPPAKAPASQNSPVAHSTLANDRQKLSYAMGMKFGNDFGKMMEPLKNDVDQSVVLKAINAMLVHGQTEMTVADAQQQMQSFQKVMQARQAAAQAKKPAPASTASAADKHKLSYAIGMSSGSGLAQLIESLKADMDEDVVIRGFNAMASHGPTELTVPGAQAQLEAFGKKMQAKKQAQAQAAGQKNLADGNAFLAANAKKPGVKTTASGLQYMVEKQGTGPKAKATDNVTVNYRGTLLDGSEFDSSAKHGGPSSFTVGGVIPGWTEALQMMNVGSKYVLWVPAKLGYGADPGGPGGPNALLKFEVELVSIGK